MHNTYQSHNTYGSITDVMEILHLDKKDQLMNTWERFRIYKLSRDGLQLNDTYTDTHKPIFQLVNSHFSKNQY
jgi:hypothetical protein